MITHSIKMAILAWLSIMSLLIYAWHTWGETRENPNKVILINSNNEVVLKQNSNKHYVAKGFINNQEVEFFVDTGATKIAIPQKIAEKLKLEKGARVVVQTANGEALAYSTKLANVTLGNISINNLTGFIQPTMEGESVLLGMNFLGNLVISQKDGELSLKK